MTSHTGDESNYGQDTWRDRSLRAGCWSNGMEVSAPNSC